MKSLFRLFLIVLFIIAAFVHNTAAQDTVVNIAYHGKLDTVHSYILNQERRIQVFVPPGYKPGSSPKRGNRQQL